MKNKFGSWVHKKVSELTIEDALEAQKDGVNFVCGDGKLRKITCDPRVQVINVLKRGVQ
jgi:hypothetical protein